MMEKKIVVMGIGQDGQAGLSAEARRHLGDAHILAGGRRQLDFFPDWTGEKIVLEGDVAAFVEALRLRYRQDRTVVLASGDPLLYGIGRALLEVIPKEDLEFLPQVSSVQLAFARIKETWHDARVVSLHGRPLEALVPAVQAGEQKIAVLTDPKNHPAAVANLLRQHNAAQAYVMWVCENLGGPDERVSRFSPASVREEVFSPLNVVVLLREVERVSCPPADLPLLGIPETALQHRAGPRGMITRREVRLLALCYLELRDGNVLWDIGAGSGSVALEAARLGSRLQVIAIERDAEAFHRLSANVARFAGGQVRAVSAEAPQGLADLPDPDAVFIGGSGGKLAEIIRAAVRRLRPAGRIVVNCIALESFSAGWSTMHELGLEPEATSVQLAHSRPLGSLHSLDPDNPILILRARKP
jgi:precorrin-6B C5,15-methyltransferase / cobalt-precorrin-6B C5,C15-methyltransferase